MRGPIVRSEKFFAAPLSLLSGQLPPHPDPLLRRRRGSREDVANSSFGKNFGQMGSDTAYAHVSLGALRQKVSDTNFSMQLFFGVRRYHRLIFWNSRQQRTRGFLNSGGSVFHLRVVGSFEYLFDYLSNPPPRCALGRTGPAYVWNNVFPDRWVTRTRAPLGPCDDVLYNVKEHAIYIS